VTTKVLLGSLRQLIDTFLTLFDTSHGGNGRSRFHGILRWCPPALTHGGRTSSVSSADRGPLSIPSTHMDGHRRETNTAVVHARLHDQFCHGRQLAYALLAKQIIAIGEYIYRASEPTALNATQDSQVHRTDRCYCSLRLILLRSQTVHSSLRNSFHRQGFQFFS